MTLTGSIRPAEAQEKFLRELVGQHTMRDALKSSDYWKRWIQHYEFEAAYRKAMLARDFEFEGYRPQYTYELSQVYHVLMLQRYSAGDDVRGLSAFFEPLLTFWEGARDAAAATGETSAWESKFTWAEHLDFYIDSFWLVGLALALEIPDAQWRRLLRLIGNDGKDALLDTIIATRSPDRHVGSSLCYPKPYEILFEAIRQVDRQAASEQLARFVETWFHSLGNAGRRGGATAPSASTQPRWYRYHQLEGGYFGYWCLEAVAAVKAFGMDDGSCLGHPHYPGDLLRPALVTAPDPARLEPELTLSLSQASSHETLLEPREISWWQGLKWAVKNRMFRS